jgi:hypothetical protein
MAFAVPVGASICANIEGRDRLVGNKDLRFHGQCAGNADSLSLSTGKLMG